MAEWLPPAIGFGLVAAVITVLLGFPHSWLGTELRRAYQVQTTGVLGRFTSKDFVRSGAMSFTIAVILTVSSVLAYSVSFRSRGTVQLLLEAYGFGFFLLAGTTLLATVQTLFHAFKRHRFQIWVAAQVAAQPREFAALREMLMRYDPVGLETLNEPAEYDYQARRILVALSRCNTYEEVLAMIRGHFQIWFPWGLQCWRTSLALKPRV
jgi:hypothetical protein